MEFRHMTELIHTFIIPLVKSCPVNKWNIWLVKLLQPVLVRCQQALSHSWSSLVHEGRAKLADINGIVAGSGIREDEVEKKLLLNLGRETAALLSTVGSQELNRVPYSVELRNMVTQVYLYKLKGLDAFQTCCMVRYV